MRLKPLILSLLCLIGAFAGARYLFRDEKDVIRNLLKDAARLASFEGQPHPFERLKWAHAVGDYFSEDISIMLLTEEGSKEVLRGRKPCIEKLVLARSYLDQFAFAFLNPEIKIKNNSAEVVLLARGIGREAGRKDYFKEEHKLRLDMLKIRGRWRIVKAENVEPYEGEVKLE
jgi:hypothetical protein